ncbi:Pentatricopeptide repeat [Quillaja saponaria]|uniref:Pentatricopeptide repeat n=1 Tax=Quillaja saponaria TaxID=32244 RepID=A0AAD7L7T3_QUISA|nr:Pentatricopeptide repeat [Quillaja saponaria]
MYDDMRSRGIRANRYTYPFVLKACGAGKAYKRGQVIHGHAVKSGFDLDLFVGNGLVAFYAKCQEVKMSRKVFDEIPDKDVVSWNSIISGYATNGYVYEALLLFHAMLKDGVIGAPDSATLVGILPACAQAAVIHAGFWIHSYIIKSGMQLDAALGMLEKGWQMFESMEAYGVEKMEEHYACMVDLLGRAGYLNKAVEMIESMPMKAGKNVYGALLGACRIHNNIKLAELAADKLFVLDPANAGRYVILAKMYEDSGRWDDASRLRKLLREKEIRKPTGYSSIEVDSIRHVFAVKDESHPFTEPIFETLEGLDRIMNEDN